MNGCLAWQQKMILQFGKSIGFHITVRLQPNGIDSQDIGLQI
jgi:hypothetical protein